VPFFADQPFWGERVYRLGAGPRPIPFARLSTDKLAQAIEAAVNDTALRRSAEALGEKLQMEDGVGKAVQFIQTFFETAIQDQL
jgi:UDP:flavonoid glycosyltransferase YjiC (YdhE family)